jgi:type II secretory pathway component PulF
MNAMIEIAKQMTFLPSTRDAAEKIADRSQKIGFAQSIAETGICSSSEILTLKTGEVSGHLDSSFAKIAEDLRIDIDRDFRLIEEWLPKLVYVLALLYVVSGLLSSLSSQMDSLNQMIEKI